MRSGTEQMVLDLAQRLLEDGHAASVVVPDVPALAGLAGEVEALGARLLRCQDVWSEGRNATGNLRALYRVYRDERPDVVHAHIPWAPAAWETIAAARLARVPAIVRTEHNPIPEPLTRRQRIKLRVLDAMVTRIVCVSAGNLRSHLRNGGRPAGKSIVIPNGVTPAAIPDVRARQAWRERLGLPADACISVMAGALVPRKGPAEFVEAAAAALQREPSLHFAIAGVGPEEAAVRALSERLGIANRVHVLGRVEPLRDAYAAFDIFVQPSQYEGLSIAMLEALYAGLPMVTTAVDGVDEAAPDGRGAIIVPIGDTTALGEGIARLAQDASLRRDLAAITQAHVRQHLTTDAMYARYAELYRKLSRR